MGHNGTVNAFVTVIGIPHSDCLLADFVKLQREEARLINPPVKSSPLLRSKEIRNIV